MLQKSYAHRIRLGDGIAMSALKGSSRIDFREKDPIGGKINQNVEKEEDLHKKTKRKTELGGRRGWGNNQVTALLFPDLYRRQKESEHKKG